MLLNLTNGELVMFKQAEDGVEAGEIGIVIRVGVTYFGVRVGDPDFHNDRIVPIEDAAEIITFYGAGASQDASQAVSAWWRHNWRNFPPVPETKVIFRVWKDNGGVIAIFPEVPTDDQGAMCGMFEHVGQHGGGHLQGVMQTTRAATPDEYAPLKRELESAPYSYRLTVRQRASPQMNERRRQVLSGSPSGAGVSSPLS